MLLLTSTKCTLVISLVPLQPLTQISICYENIFSMSLIGQLRSCDSFDALLFSRWQQSASFQFRYHGYEYSFRTGKSRLQHWAGSGLGLAWKIELSVRKTVSIHHFLYATELMNTGVNIIYNYVLNNFTDFQLLGFYASSNV